MFRMIILNKHLYDMGADSGELDDYVLTSNINWRSSITVSDKNIIDLTGIEDFTSLTHLYCYNNQIVNLDLSQNSSLEVLYSNDNQLMSLKVNNGNNINITEFYTNNNPNLTCIFVDDKDASYLSDWTIDPASTFVETQAECDALGVNNIIKDAFILILQKKNSVLKQAMKLKTLKFTMFSVNFLKFMKD